MTDIGDPAITLFVDRRLIGASRLQIVRADEAHVQSFRRVANLRRLRGKLRSTGASWSANAAPTLRDKARVIVRAQRFRIICSQFRRSELDLLPYRFAGRA